MRPRLLVFALTTCLATLPSGVLAEQSVGLAIVTDGPRTGTNRHEEIFREEILVLTEGEFDVRFRTFEGAWSRVSILDAVDRAYQDSDIDAVLVTGIVANQIVGVRDTYLKPTFLPIVFDVQLLGLPTAERGSGKANLNYLADETDFRANLGSFLEVVGFQRLALLVDSIVLEAVGALPLMTRTLGAELGVDVVVVPFSDPGADLVALIPGEAEAVMTGGLVRLEEAAIDRLIEALVARRLPSFSFDGDALVRRGFLVTDTPDSDWQRLARRTALNLQAVLLGERAEDQPVDFDAKRRLYLNLATARALDISPRFDLLVEAVTFNEDEAVDAPPLTLAEVARQAVEANLDLLDQRYGTEAGAEDIREARADLLPQISADLSVTQLDGGSSSVVSGVAAKRSTTGALTVSQLVWSEPSRAAVDLARRAQESREADLEAFRLDTVQLATVAFLDTLRSETQVRVQRDNLEITRANLELARDRVRVGTAGASDVYRWESQLATARQSAISAYASRLQARENLNRILHRPLTAPFRAVPATLEEPGLEVAGNDLDHLIDNPKSFRRATDFLAEVGLERSPELAALDSAILAKKREILSGRRIYYSPTVSLQGQLSQVLEEERVGEDVLEGEEDWTLSLSGSLPLWSGGARRARLVRAELELEQLRARRASVREQVEQGIRSNLHLANASYMSIALAREAAEAAQKSLDLVTDAYSQGAVNIIDLLDAQSAALQAREGASNAVFEFLIDLMNAQRSIGRFDFFLTPAERAAEHEQLRNYVESEDREDE